MNIVYSACFNVYDLCGWNYCTIVKETKLLFLILLTQGMDLIPVNADL